jgi:hypothetical protein
MSSPQLGSLRVREASTSVCRRRPAPGHGGARPGAAKTTRAVLNGMFNLAVRHDALTVNPVRETRPMSAPGRSGAGVDGRIEVDRVTDGLRSTRWRSTSTCRISSTSCWRRAAGSVRRWRCGTSVLVAGGGDAIEIERDGGPRRGEGLVVQERPKTAAGWRVLALPPYAVLMLERPQRSCGSARRRGCCSRRRSAPTLRDPSNTQKAIAEGARRARVRARRRRTRSVRRWRRGWMRRGGRRGRSRTSSATPSRR